MVPLEAGLEATHDTVIDAGTNDEAPEKVLIELSGLPTGAKVFVNEVPRDTNPLQFLKGSPMFTLRFEAEGYETYRRMLTPDASRSHEVGMELLDPIRGFTRQMDETGHPGEGHSGTRYLQPRRPRSMLALPKQVQKGQKGIIRMSGDAMSRLSQHRRARRRGT